MIIGASLHSKTVDFNGEIHNIILSENGDITIWAFSEISGERLLIIDERSVIEDLDGKKIEPESLKQGAKILVTYRKPLFKESDAYTAKKLVVF